MATFGLIDVLQTADNMVEENGLYEFEFDPGEVERHMEALAAETKRVFGAITSDKHLNMAILTMLIGALIVSDAVDTEDGKFTFALNVPPDRINEVTVAATTLLVRLGAGGLDYKEVADLVDGGTFVPVEAPQEVH